MGFRESFGEFTSRFINRSRQAHDEVMARHQAQTDQEIGRLVAQLYVESGSNLATSTLQLYSESFKHRGRVEFSDTRVAMRQVASDILNASVAATDVLLDSTIESILDGVSDPTKKRELHLQALQQAEHFWVGQLEILQGAQTLGQERLARIHALQIELDQK